MQFLQTVRKIKAYCTAHGLLADLLEPLNIPADAVDPSQARLSPGSLL
jgi:hypothetical protein